MAVLSFAGLAAVAVDKTPQQGSEHNYQMPDHDGPFNNGHKTTTTTPEREPEVAVADAETITAVPTDIGEAVTVKIDENEPFVATCENAEPHVIAEVTEYWQGMDELGTSLESSTTMEEVNGVLSRLSEKIGIPVEVLMADETRSLPLDAYEPDDLTWLKLNARALIAGVALIPPQMLKGAQIPRITLVENIKNEDGSKDSYLAGYFAAKPDVGGELVLDVIDAESVVHEIMHALERAMCANFPDWANKNIGAFNGEPYVGFDHYLETEQWKYARTKNRKYATAYAATDAGEDTAETFAVTLAKIGVIQPGDPDYGSIFDAKQKFLLEEMNKFYPGSFDRILAQTALLRQQKGNPITLSTIGKIVSAPGPKTTK